MENNQSYYETHFIATIEIRNGEIKVLGGPKEKQRLRAAKKETDVCFVRNAADKQATKLILHNNQWEVAAN